MKKGIILYQSKYGATKKYAYWLKETTEFDCVKISEASVKETAEYENIVLCGGIYASGIAGLSFLKKNFQKLHPAKTAILCVGASPYDEHALSEIKTRNLKGDLRNIPLFYGRGSWDEGRMTFKDRTLCRMLQKAVAKKDSSELEPWMEALLSASGRTCDWTDQAYLKPLLDFLKS